MDMEIISFLCKNLHRMKTILSITGSDSTGGSGIQADIRAITALGANAATAITSVTTQSTLGIQSFFDLPAHVVREQIEAIFNDSEPQIVKIGMLRRIDVVEAVAEVLKKYHPKHVILDTVAYSTCGDRLMSADVIEALKRFLLPLCTLVVIRSNDDASDFLTIQPSKLLVIDGKQKHGHGNLLSSAIAVMLSRGEDTATAIANAKKHIEQLSPTPAEQNGRAASLYNRFLDCVERFHTHHNDVTFYAEQLNVSSRYLTQVTKRFADKSPKAIIDDRLVNEIESLLMMTDKTVQEISFALGLSSQARLSKFYHKMRGQTPSQFRKSLNQ